MASKEMSSRGSQLDIRRLINDKEQNKLLDNAIGQHVDWKSPLAEDHYAEYFDDGFMEKLELKDNANVKLSEFWPKGGPHWDALGIGDTDRVLVEAKANIAEFVHNDACKAKSEKSIRLIKASLEEAFMAFAGTKKFNEVWFRSHYQFANRLAHLYFLQNKCNVNTQLVYIFFCNDTSVVGSPASGEDWAVEIKRILDDMGINRECDLFRRIKFLCFNVKPIFSPSSHFSRLLL